MSENQIKAAVLGLMRCKSFQRAWEKSNELITALYELAPEGNPVEQDNWVRSHPATIALMHKVRNMVINGPDQMDLRGAINRLSA
jgi:hypothetical protein